MGSTPTYAPMGFSVNSQLRASRPLSSSVFPRLSHLKSYPATSLTNPRSSSTASMLCWVPDLIMPACCCQCSLWFGSGADHIVRCNRMPDPPAHGLGRGRRLRSPIEAIAVGVRQSCWSWVSSQIRGGPPNSVRSQISVPSPPVNFPLSYDWPGG